MATLSKQEQQVLYLARSLIRDLGHDWAPSETGVESFADVCAQLSKVLGEEYDYESGEVTKAATPEPRMYRVVYDIAIENLEDTLNDLAAKGYQVREQVMYRGCWSVTFFAPELIAQGAGQSMANKLAGMLDLSSFGVPKRP